MVQQQSIPRPARSLQYFLCEFDLEICACILLSDTGHDMRILLKNAWLQQNLRPFFGPTPTKRWVPRTVQHVCGLCSVRRHSEKECITREQRATKPERRDNYRKECDQHLIEAKRAAGMKWRPSADNIRWYIPSLNF